MSRRRRFQVSTKQNSVFALNITSMTDMFTIMLVFLLQTYSTADVEIIPENGLRLPASNVSTNPVEGLRLVVSKDALKVDDHTVLSLKDRQFPAEASEARDPNFLPALFAELDKMAKTGSDDSADPKKKAIKEGRILVQADASLPYSTLRKVMYTASMAGFPQMKLVTMVGN